MPQASPSPDDARRRLLRQLHCRIAPGEVIFEEGDHSRELYILLSGALEIRRGDQVIATIREKDTYIGEMSTLLGVPRTATVAALEECEMMRVPEDRVTDFFNHSPMLALKLSRILATRLQEMNLKHHQLMRTVGRADYNGLALYERLVCTPPRRKLMTVYVRATGTRVPLKSLLGALQTSPAEAGRILTDYERVGLIRRSEDSVEFLPAEDQELRKQLDLFAAANT